MSDPVAYLDEIDPPLRDVLGRCATLCVPECCGIEAFDFSPVHIASSLLLHGGLPDPDELAALRRQLHDLRAVADDEDVTVAILNQTLVKEDWLRLLHVLEGNLEIALRLITEAEASRLDSGNT